ncbi:MAG: hypothetical protein ACI4RP_07650 [Acutalibacteraceae bacterium]
MINYGKIRSTVKPLPIVQDFYNVTVNSDVREIVVEFEGAVHMEYEYNQKVYNKDEYINELTEENSRLETQLLETQLALTEVYETLNA